MINEFVQKWLEEFQDPMPSVFFSKGKSFDDDCQALGFILGVGKTFIDRYGSAYDNADELLKIIDEIEDIQLLGSAIYTRWRYFTHWAFDLFECCKPQNREWFVAALKRLQALDKEKRKIYKFCEVELKEAQGRTYFYFPGLLLLNVGDCVIVPFGRENKEEHGTVVAVGECYGSALPCHISKIKTVIKKLDF